MPSQFLSQTDRDRLAGYPKDIPKADIDAYFHLTDIDQKILRRLRSEVNRLGFALQLCSLRYLGFFPDVCSADEEIKFLISSQLDIAVELFNPYGSRANTVLEHQLVIMEILGYSRVTTKDIEYFKTWLGERALEHDDSKLLFEMACNYFKHEKIIRIGLTRIERLIGTAKQKAEEVTYQRLLPLLTIERCQTLDALLEVGESGKTQLFWLQQTPKSNKTSAIVLTLEKIAFLKTLDVHNWSLDAINPNRLKWLARQGSKVRAQDIRKRKTQSRYPILLTFLKERLYLFTDAVTEMFIERLWEIHKECKRSFEKDRLTATQSINESLKAFKSIGQVLLDNTIDDSTVRNIAFNRLSQEQLVTALERAEHLIRPEQDAYVDYFSKKHSSVQKFSKLLLEVLSFKSQTSEDKLLQGLNLIREIHKGNRRKLPAEAATSFLPNAWRTEVVTAEGLHWRNYEIASLWVLRERLRSGAIFVKHSQRFKELESYLIPQHDWLEQRHELESLTGTPLDATTRLEEKKTDLHRLCQQVESRLQGKDDFLREDDGKLILSPYAAEEASTETTWLQQEIRKRIMTRDITDVLIDVDNIVHYSDPLTHVTLGQAKDQNLLLHLYGCLLAQACNLGFARMAKSSDLNHQRMLWVNRWFIRNETLNAANERLVTYLQTLPYADIWGKGLLSSSDGQRFPAKGNIRKARAQPRYFGYGKGVTFYTWALDRFSQFDSKAIPSTMRDATYVLDGILDNLEDLNIQEHTTDTAGFTELIFALFDLLGLKFSPRLKDIKDQQLYRFKETDLDDLPKLRGQLSVMISEPQIKDQWDEMLRLILSLKKGYVSASLIVQKLQAYPRQHPLMKVLQEYGKLIKTIHILNWYDDLATRKRIGLQLNKGENLHYLRSELFYGKHGYLDSSEDEALDNIVSCLNLVSNIVIVWNTVQIGKVVDDLRVQGHTIKDEDLAHIWPTRFEHLNIIGRYHFDTNEMKKPLI